MSDEEQLALFDGPMIPGYRKTASAEEPGCCECCWRNWASIDGRSQMECEKWNNNAIDARHRCPTFEKSDA